MLEKITFFDNFYASILKLCSNKNNESFLNNLPETATNVIKNCKITVKYIRKIELLKNCANKFVINI